MNASPLAADAAAPLPASAPGGRPPAAAWQAAWQQAQVRCWFRGPVPCQAVQRTAQPEGALPAHATGGRSAAVPTLARSVATGPGVPSQPVEALHWRAVAEAAAGGAPAVPDQDAQAAAAACVPEPGDDCAPGTSLLRMRPAAAAPSAARAVSPGPRIPAPRFDDGRAAVRVHVEAEGQAVAVWIGLDGEPAQVASQALVLLATLRRVGQACGLPLARVVCNGRALEEATPRLQSPRESS